MRDAPKAWRVRQYSKAALTARRAVDVTPTEIRRRSWLKFVWWGG